MTDVKGLVARLSHAIVTATNDDYSALLTDQRARHVARIDAMREAVEFLESLSSPAREEDVVQARLIAFVNSIEGINWVPDGCPVSTRPDIDDRRLTVGDLRALAGHAQAAPDGWKLVPKEPTEEMLCAARDWSVAKYGIGVGNDGATGCYRSMLAAAPSHQTK